MDTSIEDLLQNIAEPNHKPALVFWQELQAHVPDAAGATKSHQAWPGGYKDHIQEVMNLARILYERLGQERKLPFSAASAYLVLFLHDCEKPFRHANDVQLKAFPWISGRPTKSDKTFQKQLVAHYGFTISDEEWNALRYVEGEPESEYVEGTRLQGPLAAFCHVCDTISARIWHDYPQHA
ncbi:MAG TPA: hypothetical protein VJ836_06610 [Candidatus Saccharimonadales bacterium]|nr:hypothetical protein [Candidatus Saccharimonadales bacterium]